MAKIIYSESYKKGSIIENKDCIERIQRDGSSVEILKHAELSDGFNEITVKIKFKPLPK